MKPIAAFALLLTPALFAQHQTFAIKPDASEIKMTLKTNHEIVNGTFHVQTGAIDFDPATRTIGGKVIVLSASGNTGSDMRDKRMNKEILHVDKFTTVAFEPKSYTGTIAPSGDSTLQVTGTFTLLGTPHIITIPMLVHIEGPGATAKAHFIIPYVEWGLKNPSLLIWKAENDVAIDLNLIGTISR